VASKVTAKADSAHFQQVQRQLADHLRDPQHHAPPAGLEDRRLNVYRELFFKNILGFIARGFPVLCSLYESDDWRALVRAFYARHRCHSPYFTDIAKEFLLYLEHEHTPQRCDPPYLYELAHYEQVELAVGIAEDTAQHAAIDRRGDWMAGQPLLSATAQWHSYRWPVHRIGPDYRPRESSGEGYTIAVCRDRQNTVRYMLLNTMTARLLDYLRAHPSCSGGDAIDAVARRHCPQNLSQARQQGAQLFDRLQQKGIVLGVRAAA